VSAIGVAGLSFCGPRFLKAVARCVAALGNTTARSGARRAIQKLLRRGGFLRPRRFFFAPSARRPAAHAEEALHLHDPTTANDPARELAALQEFVNSAFADADVFGRNGNRYTEALFKRQDFPARNFPAHLASTMNAVEAMRAAKK
jgi:hypothetical protein